MRDRPDRLDALLTRFEVHARLIHAGSLEGPRAFSSDSGVLHIVERGAVNVAYASRRPSTIDAPSIVFFPSATPHRLVSGAASETVVISAEIDFDGGARHPIAHALPELLITPLTQLPSLDATLTVLFAEASDTACGRRAVLDRLFEVVLVQWLRSVMNANAVLGGMLAGLAEPRLARAITALHEHPEKAWTLDALADTAQMSRTSFAVLFKAVVGATPGDYLGDWRIAVARDLLRQGRSLKDVAGDVGYASSAALSRAFHARTGQSPRGWRAAISI